MPNITGKDLLRNSKMKRIYEHPVTHYSVWVGAEYHADSFNENITLILMDDKGNISDNKIVGKYAVIEDANKAITNVLKDCAGGLNEANSRKEVADWIYNNHSKIVRVKAREYDDAIKIYMRLFEEAEKHPIHDIFFIDEEGYCNVLSKDFIKITESIDLSCNRKKFFDSMRMMGLLVSNDGRNDTKITSTEKYEDGERHIQIRVIRLKSLLCKDGNNTDDNVEVVDNNEKAVKSEEAESTSQTCVYNTSKIVLFPYYGGKNEKTGSIIQHLIPDDIPEYHELFGGSGGVLLNLRNRPPVVHINDLDKRIYTLYKVISDKEKSRQLIDRMKAIEYSEEQFNTALENIHNNNETDDIDIAFNEYVVITQSYNCLRKNYAKDKATTGQYRKRAIKNLTRAHEKMKDVIITNNNAFDELREIVDKPSVFAYLDPPYVEELMGSKKVYRFNMSEEQQIEFMQLIYRAKCKLLVSGYRNEQGEDLYDKWLSKENGWYCVCVTNKHKASSGKKDTKAKEWVWYNYELPENAKYFVALGE